jgi:hypothetical protein
MCSTLKTANAGKGDKMYIIITCVNATVVASDSANGTAPFLNDHKVKQVNKI